MGARMPPGWNKTVADLHGEMDLGLRDSVSPEEYQWAEEYERSLLPPDVHYPREGEVYECAETALFTYMTQWAAPYSGGGKGLLRAGERVVISETGLELETLGVFARPVDYEAIEKRTVPENERTANKYWRFAFVLRTIELHTKFRLVAHDGED